MTKRKVTASGVVWFSQEERRQFAEEEDVFQEFVIALQQDIKCLL